MNKHSMIAAALAGMVLLAASPEAQAQQTETGFSGTQSPGTAEQNRPSNPPQSGAGQSAPPAESASQNRKDRLAVNPVTGMAVSSSVAYTPLTGDERWKLWWKMNFFSIGAYFGPVFSALVLDQAMGSPSQWGGGFSGYGLRAASRTGGAMLQGTIQAPIAAALHEDVRYISGEGGSKRRFLHAIAYSLLTYNNDGHPTLNVGNLSAYYASTAISTAWLPTGHSVLKYTFSDGSAQIALTLPINLLQEFWPDLTHKLPHRH